jgi:hypothetical protein
MILRVKDRVPAYEVSQARLWAGTGRRKMFPELWQSPRRGEPPSYRGAQQIELRLVPSPALLRCIWVCAHEWIYKV